MQEMTTYIRPYIHTPVSAVYVVVMIAYAVKFLLEESSFPFCSPDRTIHRATLSIQVRNF